MDGTWTGSKQSNWSNDSNHMGHRSTRIVWIEMLISLQPVHSLRSKVIHRTRDDILTMPRMMLQLLLMMMMMTMILRLMPPNVLTGIELSPHRLDAVGGRGAFL